MSGNQGIVPAPSPNLSAASSAERILISPTGEGYVSAQTRPPGESISWVAASFVHMTAIVGAGVMSIPYAYEELGLFFSMFWTILCGVYCWANSYLLYELKLFYGQNVNTFGQLASACSSNQSFGLFVDVITIFYMIFAATYYFFHMARTIQFFFHTTWNICIYNASAIGIGILLPFFQIQQVYDMVYVAIIASVTICGVIILCVSYATIHASSDPQLSYSPNDNAVNVFNGMSIITQSFSGSYLLMEIISVMDNPIKFSWSLYFTFITVFICFAVCGMVGYTQQGIHIRPYFLDVLKEDSIPRYFGSILYVIHLIGAITILVQAVMNSIFSRFRDKDDQTSKIHALKWLGMSFFVAATMFTIANVIPWIDVFGNFVGSLFGMSFSFVLPTLFYVISSVTCSYSKDLLLKVCLLIGCILWIWATAMSLIEIIQHWSVIAGPFSCLCTSADCKLKS